MLRTLATTSSQRAIKRARSYLTKGSNRHGDSISQHAEPVSTLDRQIALRTFLLIKNPSLYLERATPTSVYTHTAHFG